jgi:hypothetical protein
MIFRIVNIGTETFVTQFAAIVGVARYSAMNV